MENQIIKVEIEHQQMMSLKNNLTMQLLSCLVERNDAKLVVLERGISISTAIDGTRLNKLERQIGDFGIITAICYLINRFNTNFNVGKKLTLEQSALLASDIVEKYPNETIEDVVLMLKMVRQGIIGDGKDYKLDGQNVMTKWFPEYLEKKYEEFERQKRKELSELNTTDTGNAVSQYYAKIRKQKAQKEADEKMKTEIDEMVKSMDRQMLEDTIVDWDKKEEMKPFLDYLKRKRSVVKGEYKP